jgi:hypothetical protein
VSARDPFGAGPATFGYDGNPYGVEHIVDVKTGKPLYRHAPCEICGIASWFSTPEPRPCGSCLLGRIERNDNEAAA